MINTFWVTLGSSLWIQIVKTASKLNSGKYKWLSLCLGFGLFFKFFWAFFLLSASMASCQQHIPLCSETFFDAPSASGVLPNSSPAKSSQTISGEALILHFPVLISFHSLNFLGLYPAFSPSFSRWIPAGGPCIISLQRLGQWVSSV